ncbi:hypothetical protein [Conexibacter sp. CPCC 206217]|uniref:hypothetical protein n=1 Tax=Conexibacter sp. CPCC 206217 TaxID=3064574 RepID=UPI002718E9CE|nr:hypothetical protein [Conexibacter sp. CPCC 206217]MDO8212587.1 hypothetical protein [Conexibacter sp. CPCC 206217]
MSEDANTAPRPLRLDCPCGERLVGRDEDELVERAYEHLRADHPQLADEYTRDHILAMAF